MFGLEILDIILGLAFVYLLLSLICSAINEYIASMLNKRGRVLMDGLQTLLKDTGLDDRFFDHPLISTQFPHHGSLAARAEKLNRWPWGTRWIYRFLTWAFRPNVRKERYPSYLTARSFATAFLEISESLGALPGATTPAGGSSPPPRTPTDAPPPSTADAKDAEDAGTKPDQTLSGSTPIKPQDVATPDTAAGTSPASAGAVSAGVEKLQKLLATLERDSAADVTPFPNLALLEHVGSAVLPDDVKRKIADAALGERDRLQKLQNSVELWFNNSMDRVSGAYKRHTQHVLFAIGLAVAFALNTDTIDLWRRLSTDDKLRDTLATQAALAMPQLASLASDSARGDTIRPAADTTRKDTARQVSPTDTTGGNAGGNVTPPARQGAGGTRADTTRPANTDTTKDDLARARAVIDSSTALLDRTTLNLGWSVDDLAALGMATQLDARYVDSVRTARVETDSARTVERLAARGGRVDSAAVGREAAADNPPRTYVLHGPGSWRWGPILAKLLGLLLTAFALSLGAPFWFDTLNKIINIRAAGRAPQEVARTPAVTSKTSGGAAPS